MSSGVIIIGSGTSGLTAAALLAKKGRKVTIVEQNSRPGGALKRFRRDDIDFDIGFHYSGGLGKDQILSTLWRYLGVYDLLDILPFPLDAADSVSFYGSRSNIQLYFSYPQIIDELSRLFPDEQQGIQEFFSVIKKQAESIPYYSMEDGLESFTRSFGFMQRDSLDSLIRTTVKNKELQTALALPAFLYGTAPKDISSMLHASVAHPVYSGVYTVNGGGQTIVDCFMNVLDKQGVQILSNSVAEKLVVDNGQVAGLQTSQGYLPASDVIFTGHPAFLFQLAPMEYFRKAYVNRLNRLQNTPSMFMIFGAIKSGDLDKKSIWNNYYHVSAGLDFISDIHYSDNPCLFLSPCGFRDSKYNMSSTSYRAAIVMRTASWKEVADFYNRSNQERIDGYKEWKLKETDKLLQKAKSAFPDIMKKFDVITTSTPLTFKDELNYPEGAVYGIRQSPEHLIIGPKTRLPGLWLSGQSTLMPGLLGASISALVTVGSMLSDLEQLWQDVREWA